MSEKNAKTIRKMCVQKHKNVIRNVKGKKSLSGNVAATQGNLRLLSWRSENIESGKGWSAGEKIS